MKSDGEGEWGIHQHATSVPAEDLGMTQPDSLGSCKTHDLHNGQTRGFVGPSRKKRGETSDARWQRLQAGRRWRRFSQWCVPLKGTEGILLFCCVCRSRRGSSEKSDSSTEAPGSSPCSRRRRRHRRVLFYHHSKRGAHLALC